MIFRQAFTLFFIFLLCCLAALINYYALSKIPQLTSWPALFTLLVSVSYAFIYLLPLFITYQGLKRINRPRLRHGLMLLLAWLIVLLLLSDLYLYKLYGFHINGFVPNVIFTPGGIESL